MKTLIILFTGFSFSIFIGHFMVKYLNRYLRRYVGGEVELEPNKLTPTLGNMERIIYTLLYIFNLYGFIATYFTLTTASRLISFTKIENKELYKEMGARINIYFISNIASLILGILGGIIIKWFNKSIM